MQAVLFRIFKTLQEIYSYYLFFPYMWQKIKEYFTLLYVSISIFSCQYQKHDLLLLFNFMYITPRAVVTWFRGTSRTTGPWNQRHSL